MSVLICWAGTFLRRLLSVLFFLVSVLVRWRGTCNKSASLAGVDANYAHATTDTATSMDTNCATTGGVPYGVGIASFGSGRPRAFFLDDDLAASDVDNPSVRNSS